MKSQISLQETVNFLDRNVYTDSISVYDTNGLLTICEKMENFVIQQKRQTYTGDIFSKN